MMELSDVATHMHPYKQGAQKRQNRFRHLPTDMYKASACVASSTLMNSHNVTVKTGMSVPDSQLPQTRCAKQAKAISGTLITIHTVQKHKCGKTQSCATTKMQLTKQTRANQIVSLPQNGGEILAKKNQLPSHMNIRCKHKCAKKQPGGTQSCY